MQEQEIIDVTNDDNWIEFLKQIEKDFAFLYANIAIYPMTDAGDTRLFIDSKIDKRGICFGRANNDFGYDVYSDCETCELSEDTLLDSLPNNIEYQEIRGFIKRIVIQHFSDLI